MNKTIAILIFYVFCSCILSTEVRANPSTTDPEALLKITPSARLAGEHRTTDYAALQALYAKAKSQSDELWKKHEDQKLAIGDARQIGPLYLQIAALRRSADSLISLAEPCGYDLSLRTTVLEIRLDKVVRALLQLPGVNQTLLMKEVEKANAAGMKRLPQIEALLKRQQYLEAEGELEEIFDSVMRHGVWILGREIEAYVQPFRTPLPEATQLRKAHVTKELLKLAAEGPDFTQLQTELTQAAAAIGETGRATWNGQPLTGPELLQAWNQQWPKTQAAAQRAAMAAWKSENLNEKLHAKYRERLEAQQRFAQSLPATLAAIVRADAQRAAGPEAGTLYRQYVAASGTLCALGPRPELEAALAPALAALATKAGLNQEVAGYRAATEPVLAWKRFLARAQVQRLTGTAPRVHDWCATALHSPDRLIKQSLITAIPADTRTVQIADTPDLVLPGVLPAGQKPVVVVGDVVPVGAPGSRGVARYVRRVFALVAPPPPEAWKVAGDQLEQSLLASPAQAPLTLEAATALAGARLGVFESAGGAVENLTVEPLLPRFITLPDEAATLLPRGAWPGEVFDGGGIDPDPQLALTLRCDLPKPVWLQHECFVLLP